MRTPTRRTQSPRTRRAVLTIVFATFCLPAAAHAATVSVAADGTVVYRAADGEANSLEIAGTAERVDLRDLREPIAAGSGCVERAARVECAATHAPLRAIVANLGDRADVISVRTAFATTVDGGPGNDTLLAGAFSGVSSVDFLGGGGVDTADYAAATAPVRDTIRGDVEVVLPSGATAAKRKRLRRAAVLRARR